jgi:antirestriction protein
MSRIFVTTYRKLNDGNSQGQWFDLEDFTDRDDFIEACLALHNDEDEPELLFSDYEDIPKEWVSECDVDYAVWDWLNLAQDDRELLAMYREHINPDGDIDSARDAFLGSFSDLEDWAIKHWEETGMIDQIPEFAQAYIDYAYWARDAELGGDITGIEADGWIYVFSSH